MERIPFCPIFCGLFIGTQKRIECSPRLLPSSKMARAACPFQGVRQLRNGGPRRRAGGGRGGGGRGRPGGGRGRPPGASPGGSASGGSRGGRRTGNWRLGPLWNAAPRRVLRRDPSSESILTASANPHCIAGRSALESGRGEREGGSGRTPGVPRGRPWCAAAIPLASGGLRRPNQRPSLDPQTRAV